MCYFIYEAAFHSTVLVNRRNCIIQDSEPHHKKTECRSATPKAMCDLVSWRMLSLGLSVSCKLP
jgi:hypothetical protein